MPKPSQVFISHSTKDHAFIEREIVSFLEGHGIKAWYSPENIETASQWERGILDGLRKSDWFLVVMSPRSVESDWVLAEVHWAMEERKNQFVPVLIEDCEWQDLHLKIRTIQHVDFRQNLEVARRRLLRLWGIAYGAAEVGAENVAPPGSSSPTEQDREAANEWITIQLARKMYVVSEETLLKSIRRGEVLVQDANTGATKTLLLKTEDLDNRFYPRALLPLIVAGAAGGISVSVFSAFISFLREHLGASKTENVSSLMERFDTKYVGETARQQLERASSSDRATRSRLQNRTEPARPSKVITNSIGMKLALIPAGEFLMGSPDSDKRANIEEKPQHRVAITLPFHLGVYPVTQSGYRKVMGNNPSRYKGDDRRPVESVSWFDAVAFCNKLSEAENIKRFYKISGSDVTVVGGGGYRLPTEAEWEYACRAGSTTAYCFGDDPKLLGTYAWFTEKSGTGTQPVGTRRPNQWSLHDMHGNVWEWCQDRYGPYSDGAQENPAGPNAGDSRVLRGGSFCDNPQYLRSADRRRNTPESRNYVGGFRISRTP